MIKNRKSRTSQWGRVTILLSLAMFTVIIGCRTKEKEAPKVEPPLVTVAPVKFETVPVYLPYVGNSASVKTVDMRARVEGFLEQRRFKEGDDVKKGDLVYVIEREPYLAELEKCVAQLAKDEAALAFAREQVKRYRPLAENDFVTRENFDDYCTKEKEAAAAVEADRARITTARLNLSYCTMYSPLNGRIGRTLVHVGNLVGATGDTKLATIVQLDPIYVYFSPSDKDLRLILKHKQKGALPVDIVLSDGSMHPHQGKVDFIDNTADPKTNTVTMRAVVPNPEKTLLPGVYVQARLFLCEVPNTPLIPEQAIAEDQGGPYVYVVGPDKKVEFRRVRTSFAYKGQKTVPEGLKKGEIVIIEGMQMVRPEMVVKTQLASEKKNRESGPPQKAQEKSSKKVPEKATKKAPEGQPEPEQSPKKGGQQGKKP